MAESSLTWTFIFFHHCLLERYRNFLVLFAQNSIGNCLIGFGLKKIAEGMVAIVLHPFRSQ